MKYFLNLFSPETYEAFSRSDRLVSGFRLRHERQAQRIKPGDRFLCYLTKLSRWVGALEVVEGPFVDDTPIFYEQADPFVVRFRVRPVVWLQKQTAVPIREDVLWDRLSFTKGQDRNASTWTGKLRSSLAEIDITDAEIIMEVLLSQATHGRVFEVDERQYARWVAHRVHRLDRVVTVTVPEDSAPDPASTASELEATSRESLRVQALLADIGSQMGFRIWLPRADRTAVCGLMKKDKGCILERLPLNYDETTIRTVEQIDVIWLKGRAIARAFEVEHTTAVHSGLLRMADLLALQPNMDIRLHIVAPAERREKVFAEIRRPVFSLLDKGPLSETCTFISYESLRELERTPHLKHLADSVLDEFAEEPD